MKMICSLLLGDYAKGEKFIMNSNEIKSTWLIMKLH